jgi:hypothetical protein
MFPYAGGIGGPGGMALPMLALAAMASVALVVALVAWLLLSSSGNSSSGNSNNNSNSAIDRGKNAGADDLLGKSYVEAVQYIMGQDDIDVPVTVVRWGNTQTLTTRPGTVYVVVNDSGSVLQLMDSLKTPSLTHGGIVAQYNGDVTRGKGGPRLFSASTA